MCKVFKVSRSSYYHWITKPASERLLRRIELGIAIKKIYDWSKGRYGSPRITKELQMQGVKVSRPLVASIMRKKNLQSITVKRFKQTTNSSHNYRLVDNKLFQHFTTTAHNQVWVSDITYIKTKEGWSYLTSVIDLFDRKVIGWHFSYSLKAEDTVIPALNKACSNRPLMCGQSLIFHSDRGVQYACNQFKNTLKNYKWIEQSMSGKGNCYDNAVAESFFKTLKTELIYQNYYSSKYKAYMSVFEYIEGFYNTNRRHSFLDYLTIKEFNEQHKFKNIKVA
ncbi:integrase [Elizabethkingia meningoseptica]|nr:integrase [Elizabethkingia meningoseptica]